MYYMSQFHFGSIQTLLKTKISIFQISDASQFHFGSIQTTFSLITDGDNVTIVSIPLWFNSNGSKSVVVCFPLRLCLNSTLVQFKQNSMLQEAASSLWRSLNSTLVQFKRRTRIWSPWNRESSLNSTLVQFKPPNGDKVSIGPHSGVSIPLWFNSNKYYSYISKNGATLCLNSTLVQFKRIS